MTYCGICGRSDYEVKIYKSSGLDICFDCRRERNLQGKYNMSLVEYNKLFEKQKGLCAIYKKPPGKKVLFVDHCHKTKKIRGLLCTHCNSMLGFAKDSISNLASAIKYLEKS